MEARILKSSSDFHWYKQELDLESRTSFKHIGKPEKYPCQVTSRVQFNSDCEDEYYHTFNYQREVVCSECGHTTLSW